MNRPAVFFDRDNTLIANDGYLGDPRQVELVDGAAAAVARVRAMGFATVVVSNQSGVARGLFDESAVQAVDARMDSLLQADNPLAVIDRHEFCPFHPEAVDLEYRQDSPLRKPAPGMLLAAAEAMSLDLAGSWIIGDAPRDIAAGKAAGCRAILYRDPSFPRSPAAEQNGVAPDFTVSSLAEAVDLIERHRRPAVAAPSAPVKPAAAVVNQADTLAAALAARKGGIAPSAAGALTGGSSPAPRPPVGAPAALAGSPVPRPPVGGPAALQADPVPKVDPSPSSSRLESLVEQVLMELRRRGEILPDDFSVAKLLAGILQIAVMAVLLLAYLQGRGNVAWLQIYMLLALTLQVMTISLLFMSRLK